MQYLSFSIPPAEIISLYISVAALLISLIVGFFQVKTSIQRKFNIKMEFDPNCSLYIPPLATNYGNVVSLIIKARIVNQSENPITINSIEIRKKINGYNKSVKCYPGGNGEGSLIMGFPVDDCIETIDVVKECFQFPLHLSPYAEQTHFIIFVHAFEPTRLTEEKIKLTAITSRGEKRFTITVPTEDYKKLIKEINEVPLQ